MGDKRMIFVILKAVIGSLFALFIPGFLVVLIFFKNLSKLQKIAVSAVFSLIILVAISIFLGYNEKMMSITGGVTEYNLWIYELIISGILLTTLILKEKLIFK